MSKPNKDSKKKKARLISGRRGIVLVVLLAVMILVVNIVTLSYSWFKPAVEPGTGMHYKSDVRVRSENCEIVGTYKAADVSSPQINGKWDFSDTTAYTGEQTISANSIQYFKTVVKNLDTAPSNISLYIKSLPAKVNGSAPAAGSTFETFGLGVGYPSNSYHKYSTSQSDIYIARNAYIGGKDSNEEEIYFIWFIKTGSKSVTVDLTPYDPENPTASCNLYISYN